MVIVNQTVRFPADALRLTWERHPRLGEDGSLAVFALLRNLPASRGNFFWSSQIAITHAGNLSVKV